MQVDLTLHTDGRGYWSTVQKEVKVTRIVCITYDDDFYEDDREVEEESWGEMRVFFDTSTWDISKDGLIYTDKLFENELNAYLATLGLPEAEYSEQGMQGEDFVSFDIDGEFITGWGLAGQEVLV
jgi:hypothetical protein